VNLLRWKMGSNIITSLFCLEWNEIQVSLKLWGLKCLQELKIYAQLLTPHNSKGGGHKLITMVKYVIVNFMQLWFNIVSLYMLHFFQLQIVPIMTWVHLFWKFLPI
jgi:hypothetical protein